MGNVLYETHFRLEPFIWAPIVMLMGIVLFLLIQGEPFAKTRKKMSEVVKKAPKLFVIAVGCFGAFMFVLIGQTYMHFKTAGAYEKGQYETVEGYVENFNPMPYEGHAHESFEIDGVHFEYSDYDVTPGYRNAKSHGGVITGDGQYLKIGYVYYNSVYGNIIVYIEELSPPS